MKPVPPSDRRRLLAPLLAGTVGLMLAACSHSPPIHYYTLSVPGADFTPAASDRGPSLVVGPVSLPAEVDRQQMVRVVDGVRLEVATEHRWAGPLKAEIGRRVAGEIARLRGLQRVVAWPQNTYADPDLTLPVDIQRLDTIGFDRVRMEAVWSLRRNQRELIGGRVAIAEKLDGEDFAAVARAHARLVDALAREIAGRMPGS